VGNPPYVNAKNGNFTEKEKEYFYKNYETAEYQLDTYILFIEKAIKLLNNGGYTGFIIPNAWLGNVFVPKIREFLLKNTEIKGIVELGNSVFEDANVDTVILIVKKCNPNPEHEIKIGHFVKQKYEFRHFVKQSLFLENKGFVFDINLDVGNRKIIDKMEEVSVLIGDILEVSTGIKEYQVGKGKPAQTQQDKDESRFNASFKKDETFVPELRGKNIDRYESNWQNEFVSYGQWIAEPRKPKFFEGERILLRKIPASENLIATFTDKKFIIDQSLYIALNEEKQLNTKYILACLNSKVLGWYFKYKNNEFDDLFPQIKVDQFKSLPIPIATPEEQAQIAEMVDQIMELKANSQNLTNSFLKLITAKYKPTTISTKLKNWHKLEIADFLDELKKQKAVIGGLSAESELMAYFEEQKGKVIEVEKEAERVDGEIEGSVRVLYKL